MKGEPKYHRMFYNFVAKRLREVYPRGPLGPFDADNILMNGGRRIVEQLALDFAARFKEDNPDFDVPRFLDQCSPDADLYPFSELWEAYEHDRSSA